MCKINCDVINDLLPLYLENMVSDSTKEIVDEHIEHCDNCRNKLNSMEKEMKIPADVSTNAILRIKNQIERKNIRTAIFAGLIVLVMVVLIIIHLNSPISLGYRQDIVSVVPNTNGSVSVALSDEVAGYSIEYLKDESSAYSITCWNTLWNKYISNNGNRTIKIDANGTNREVQKIYYYSTEDKSGDLLIYNASGNESKSFSGRRITLPRLALNYYFLISFVLAVIGIILSVVTKKQGKHRTVVRITFIPVCYLLSSIFVLMGHGNIYNSEYYFTGILILSIVLYSLIHYIFFKLRFRK